MQIKKLITKFFHGMLLILIVFMSSTVFATALDLTGFQKSDGAITVGRNGVFVDPYFATLALILAQDSGLDTKAVALPWISWLMQRQHPDGRFARYCLSQNDWVECLSADADDSMMALWSRLILSYFSDPGMPAQWNASLQQALNYLQNNLYDEKLGLYQISINQNVFLFMDNIEIYKSFADISSMQLSNNFPVLNTVVAMDLPKFYKNIQDLFWNKESAAYKISSQPNQTPRFYPDGLAQIYPWALNVPSQTQATISNFENWLRDWNIYRRIGSKEFTWGIIALASKKANDELFTMCLMQKATTLRTQTWNVVDEAVYQSLKPFYTCPPQLQNCDKIDCFLQARKICELQLQDACIDGYLPQKFKQIFWAYP